MAQGDSDYLWRTIDSCSSLKSLAVSKVSVSHESWRACWSVWSRLTQLTLLGVDFTPLCSIRNSLDINYSDSDWNQDHLCGGLSELLSQEDPQPPMRINTLKLKHSKQAHLEDELALLKHCLDLETFAWHVSLGRFTGNQFGQQLATESRHCPKLADITLSLGVRNANVLIPFLKEMEGGQNPALEGLESSVFFLEY
jgi:hypothetical protein